MVLFPNGKINLGLHITGKRPDGYHNLETVFYPLPIRDIVEIIPSDHFEFQASGLSINVDPDDNLCTKAYQLLKKDFPQLPDIKIWLHKNIPMGAGLGGGSADASFLLKLLNDKFILNLSTNQLIQYASQLGSDCPFFIHNSPCYATGRGEILEPIQLDLSAYSFVLVYPGIHIGTAWAFSQIKSSPPTISIKEIIQNPVSNWKETLKNDFEPPVLNHYPALKDIKENLYQSGAVYASLTGSGSAFYGIFPFKPTKIDTLFESYKCFVF
ncbi:MAG: 4-(cytidine 5'-diphospho)-2-C-methyl-D-erythritol kinase [Bacteroidetes bacterium]|nr:4-(cytidine 5'-diphospho)-2-C-methyl-D-erythritol kinase [Bacteroidota bacterium]